MDALAVVQPKSRHKFPKWSEVLAQFNESRGKTKPVPAWQAHRDLMAAKAAAAKDQKRKRKKKG